MNCISLEKLILEWDKDSTINQIEPGQEILNIPKLHSKYVTQITAHSVSLEMKKLDYIRKEKLKIEYYSGRLSEAQLKELGWKPFQFILKTDIQKYIDSDEDLIELRKKMISNKEAITLCNSIVKELNSRTFQLRAYMDWEKFIRGQN